MRLLPTRRQHLILSALGALGALTVTPRLLRTAAAGTPAGAGRAAPDGPPSASPLVSLPAPVGAYALPNTFVHPLPDPVSGRRYEVWVDLPPGVSASTQPVLPSVFVTDAPYAFPMVRALRHRVGQRGQNIADFALVGLAGPADESAVDMRNRDYTPTDPLRRPVRGSRHYGGQAYGGGADYLRYLADVAVPAVSSRYGLDPRRRVLLGHSYGALLAAQVLLTRTHLFSHYILGSPSYWFDERVMFERAAAHARDHRDLSAQVFQYVGAFEAVGRGDRYNREIDLVADARRFQFMLERARYPSLRIRTAVLAGQDHLTVAPDGATQGLLWALPGRGPYTGG